MEIANWIENRIRIARKLYSGECDGNYVDAVIILVSVISGIASRTWPGKSKDRKRFIEILVRFCPNDLHLTRISIPLLIQDLYEENHPLATLLSSAFYGYCPSEVITGNKIDKSEAEILEVASSLSIKKIRSYSYANLLYQEVRSGLVHEYCLTEKASTYPMAIAGEDITYVNIALLLGKTHTSIDFKTYRTIHFEYSWLEKLVQALQDSLDLIWQNAPHPDPPSWWIEG